MSHSMSHFHSNHTQALLVKHIAIANENVVFVVISVLIVIWLSLTQHNPQVIFFCWTTFLSLSVPSQSLAFIHTSTEVLPPFTHKQNLHMQFFPVFDSVTVAGTVWRGLCGGVGVTLRPLPYFYRLFLFQQFNSTSTNSPAISQQLVSRIWRRLFKSIEINMVYLKA